MTVTSDPPHISPAPPVRLFRAGTGVRRSTRARPAPTGRDRLVLTVTIRGTSCALTLSGSLDRDSAVALESQFDQLAGGDIASVALDVDGLQSLDDAGSRSLARLGQLLSDRGTQMLVAGRPAREATPGPEAAPGRAGGRFSPGPRQSP